VKQRRKISYGYVPKPALPVAAERGRVLVPAPGPQVQSAGVEDDVYYKFEVARVLAQLVRPRRVAPGPRARDILLWGFLLRTIQTHLYVHSCTPLYCLKNRSSCRFFFPWPEQGEQQFDETTQRVALRRPHAQDDQFIVPHNVELAAFSPGTVNVLLFDPTRGADQARSYACKY